MTAKTATKDTTSTMPQAGDMAPAFTLAMEENKTFSLADQKGKFVVLYFYPKDDTPGCTIEAKDFRDLEPEFLAANTVIIGLSKDPVKSHDKFKDKFCLPFQLGSDEDGKVCEKYGVWQEKAWYGKKYMGISRTTYVIGETGVIEHVYPKVSVSEHVETILSDIQKGNE